MTACAVSLNGSSFAVPKSVSVLWALADPLVQAQVTAVVPVRRGAAALVVTATTVSDPPTTVSATRQLDVALAADALPGPIGIGSLLLLPGLVALWTAITVWNDDRRRIGLAPSTAGKQIWDDKLWLAAALGHIEYYFYPYVVVNAVYAARALLSVALRFGRFEPVK